MVGEFKAVWVSGDVPIGLAESGVAHQLMVQHSPRGVFTGLGGREYGDDVGDVAVIECDIDVSLQVVNGLMLGLAISSIKDLKRSPKMPSYAPVGIAPSKSSTKLQLSLCVFVSAFCVNFLFNRFPAIGDIGNPSTGHSIFRHGIQKCTCFFLQQIEAFHPRKGRNGIEMKRGRLRSGQIHTVKLHSGLQ